MRALLVAILLTTIASAHAGQASCRDYTAAVREDRSLFDGFILGYVSAKLEGVGGDVNATTLKMKQLVSAYCWRDPAGSIGGAVGLFTESVIQANR